MTIPRAPKPTFVPIPTIRLCPVCAPSPAFRPTSRATPARLHPHSYARAAPPLRTFVRIPTHEPLPRLRTFARIPTSQPPHACALSCPTPRPGFAPSAYLRPHSHPRAAPRLHTFAPNPMIRLCPVCAPPSSFLRTFLPTSTYFFTRFYVLFQSLLHTCSTNH